MKHRFIAAVVLALSMLASACSSSGGGGGNQNPPPGNVQLTGTVQVQGASNQSGQ